MMSGEFMTATATENFNASNLRLNKTNVIGDQNGNGILGTEGIKTLNEMI